MVRNVRTAAEMPWDTLVSSLSCVLKNNPLDGDGNGLKCETQVITRLLSDEMVM